MKKNIFSFIIIALFLIVLVRADLGTEIYKFNKSIDLQYVCDMNGAIPSGSATLNISIAFNNGTYLVNNQQATSNGNGNFYYNTLFPTNEIYKYQIICIDGSSNNTDYGYYDVTYGGNPSPHALIILGFGFTILLILSGSVLIIVKMIGHIIQKDYDILDLATAWGLYFALLGLGQLAYAYLNNIDMINWITLFIQIYAVPMMIVPIIALILSIFSQKRNADAEAKKW